MSFPGVFKLWDLYVGASLRVYRLRSRIYIYIYIYICIRKSRRGRLVNWVEKASFKKIQKLLEIFDQERHHEILLTARNLRELSRSPSPYIIPVIPRPLPTKIVNIEHYIIANLLNLAPGSLSPVKTSETETVGRALVISTQPGQPSLDREDYGLISQASKEDDRGSRFERLPFAKKEFSSCPPSI